MGNHQYGTTVIFGGRREKLVDITSSRKEWLDEAESTMTAGIKAIEKIKEEFDVAMVMKQWAVNTKVAKRDSVSLPGATQKSIHLAVIKAEAEMSLLFSLLVHSGGVRFNKNLNAYQGDRAEALNIQSLNTEHDDLLVRGRAVEIVKKLRVE